MHAQWKVNIDAAVAGSIDYALSRGNVSGRPRYGARNKLINALLANWISTQVNPSKPDHPLIPSLEELLVYRRS